MVVSRYFDCKSYSFRLSTWCVGCMSMYSVSVGSKTSQSPEDKGGRSRRLDLPVFLSPSPHCAISLDAVLFCLPVYSSALHVL